jgi:hypothetical protein
MRGFRRRLESDENRLRRDGNFRGILVEGKNGKRQAFAPFHKCSNLAREGPICLECAAIFGHLPLTIRCRLLAIQGWG